MFRLSLHAVEAVTSCSVSEARLLVELRLKTINVPEDDGVRTVQLSIRGELERPRKDSDGLAAEKMLDVEAVLCGIDFDTTSVIEMLCVGDPDSLDAETSIDGDTEIRLAERAEPVELIDNDGATRENVKKVTVRRVDELVRERRKRDSV